MIDENKKNTLVLRKDIFNMTRELQEAFNCLVHIDEDFYKAQNVGISNSQLYKQAGNSIVVNVLQAIFRQFNFEKVA